jgi:hypothetical protein
VNENTLGRRVESMINLQGVFGRFETEKGRVIAVRNARGAACWIRYRLNVERQQIPVPVR